MKQLRGKVCSAAVGRSARRWIDARGAGVLLAFCITTCLVPHRLGAQPRLIELKRADSLIGRYIGEEEVRELIGNVHFIQTFESGEVVKVWCDRALRFMTQNKVELFGNVHLMRDSVVLRSSEGIYFGNERRADMLKGVSLHRGSMHLTARRGSYFPDEKRAYFAGDVVVSDRQSTTSSRELTYFESDERSIAVGSVRVEDRSNGVTVFGDSLIHFDRLGYTIVPLNPRLVQIDTTADGAVDTLVVVSKLMEAFRDTSNRFIAVDSVLMARSDLSAQCGRATYFIEHEMITLEQHPVVWYDQSQVSGDSIVVRLEERKLKSVYVRGRAMAITRSDSLHAQRFDQLTGRELTLHFTDRKLERIEAERNAISLYYLYEDERPNGVNRSSGDRITIDFADGRVDRIRIVGGAEGKYYPEVMVEKNEHAYNLDGFRWLDQRPRRRNTHIVTDGR